MLQRDLQTVIKSGIVTVATVAYMSYILPTLAASRLIVELAGNTLLLLALGSFVLSIDPFQYTQKSGPDLLPQTQLALWVIGMAGVMLATDGLSRLEPLASAWAFAVIGLSLASRAGFIWLWQHLLLRRG